MFKRILNYFRSKLSLHEIKVPCSAEQDWEWHNESE